VAAYRALARQPATHLEADGIGSFVYRSPRPLRQEAFERFLTRLPRGVLRAKGIVRFAGRDWHALFNFTCGRHELTWIRLEEAGEENQAVFIGRGLERLRERIEAELAACEVDAERSKGHAGAAPGGADERAGRT